MNSKIGVLVAALLGVAKTACAADLPNTQPAAPLPPPVLASCANPADFFMTACPLTYYGVTVYGMLDLGVGYQDHASPFNRFAGTGVNEVVTKSTTRGWLFQMVPGAMGGSGGGTIGVKGAEPLGPGWTFIFNWAAGFDPYSLQLIDGARSLADNNGLPLALQNAGGDSSRAGQWYNGVGYVGVSSTTFGTLTFGRQSSLTLDGVVAYDPFSAAPAFSVIGFAGSLAGAGDTEDTRFNTSVKYRLNIGQFRIGAMAMGGGQEWENGAARAFEGQVGGDFDIGGGTLALDAIYARLYDAVSLSSLNALQNIAHPGTLAASLTDNENVMLLAKYKYGPVQFYGGFERTVYMNPSNPQFATFETNGGYYVNGADITNGVGSPKDKVQDTFWTGAKYAVTSDLDFLTGYYHQNQYNYNPTPCSNSSSSKCSGSLDGVSAAVDWRFRPKFDIYGGLMFTEVNNGLANGYLHHTAVDPTVGLRFQF
jgi:predicted porin